MTKRCLGCMELFGDEFEICPHCGYVVGSTAEEAIHIKPGTLLYDRYIVGKVLGYGGFGVTYLGWDGKLEQKVAIKEYLPSEFSTRMPGQSQLTIFNGEKNNQFNDGLRKFVDEAKYLAKFQNEQGIVKIFDSFEENDTAYIVMEYLDGETLTAYMKRVKTIPEDEAVNMMIPVMESLKIVHDAGLLHRDIAPDNIFLTKSGEVKLIDFGASRYATTSHSRSLTVIIKPGFSPEEQYRSRGDQGPHTDVYALAATLYKMITGKTPPDAMERRAKCENQNKDILEEPRKINKKISLNRQNAILNAMNVRIEDRTPDIAEFIKELNADPPVKRVYGKIKKIDLYSWPLWLKILIPSVLSLILVLGGLLLTGKIKFSKFTEKIKIPENVMTVPDVEGMYKDEALEEISESKLLPLTDGSVESEFIPAGKIVYQTPIGGTYMNVNGSVKVMISSGKEVSSPENGIATVPYVIWDSKEDAISKLLTAGLAEPEITEQNDENVAIGSVISQIPEPGTEVEEGTAIKLVISKGPSSFELPDVVGEDKDKAESLLNEKGLVVTIEYEKNDSVPENEVIKQNIAGGTSVKRGDEIIITVSSGKETIVVADVSGKTKDEAEEILEEQGFKVSILENYSSDIPNGDVISQYPYAGTSQLPDATIVIYVSKGKQSVTVSFDANGGTVGETSRDVFVSDTYGALPTAERTGYTFSGWAFNKSGRTPISASTEISMTSSHTLYAQWIPKNYTVTFDAKGGTTSTSSTTITFGSNYNNLPEPTRTGYDFAGWSLSESGGSIVNASTIANTASNHKLYAQWTTKVYNIYLKGNGSSYSGSKTVEYGKPYGELPVPKRDYYNFDGWYTSASGGSKISESTVMKTAGDMTYYAHWIEKPLSDWIPIDDLPEGEEAVEERWSYSYTESKKSTDSNLDGWTQTGFDWQKVNEGTEKYAIFPDGFDKSHSIYKTYNQEEPKSYETATKKVEVTNKWTGYIYWHWINDSTDNSVTDSRHIYNKNEIVNGVNYNNFYAFTSSDKKNYSSDQNYCNNLGITNYIIDDQMNEFDECGGSNRWFRFDYFLSTYTEYEKIYTYERKIRKTIDKYDETIMEDNFTDLVCEVRYRPK